MWNACENIPIGFSRRQRAPNSSRVLKSLYPFSFNANIFLLLVVFLSPFLCVCVCVKLMESCVIRTDSSFHYECMRFTVFYLFYSIFEWAVVGAKNMSNVCLVV